MTPARPVAGSLAYPSALSGCQLLTGGLTTRPERRQRVQTQTLRVAPSIHARMRCRLARIGRDVTLWAWLMLRPMTVPLPQ